MPLVAARTNERKVRKGRKERTGSVLLTTGVRRLYASIPIVFAVFAVFAFLVITARPARADDPWKPPPHLRPETAEARDLVADATASSPLLRELVDRIEASDVIVYIRHTAFRDSTLTGRIGILSVAAGWRYLVIELACGRLRFDQMATLGHELHHAVEIAGEPSIVDTRSLAAFYSRIGMRTGGLFPGQMFETLAARDAGLTVKRQVMRKDVRTAEDK